jgi:hypothetical protein
VKQAARATAINSGASLTHIAEVTRMQAKFSLTQEQQRTLESTYSFLKAATVYLEAHAAVVCAEDFAHAGSLVNFGVLCISRLVEFFPEIAEFERRGEVQR